MYVVVSGDVHTITGFNVILLMVKTGLDPTVATSQAKADQEDPSSAWQGQVEVRLLGQDVGAEGEAFYSGKETGLLSVLIDSLCSS